MHFQPVGIVTKLSTRSVDETVARLSGILAARGLKLFAVIDHSGEARVAGLDLRETKVVIFGSPVAGTPVMDGNPLVALDLPLKVLVFDDEGQTTLVYLAPDELARRYGLSDEESARLAGIKAIVDAVTA